MVNMVNIMCIVDFTAVHVSWYFVPSESITTFRKLFESSQLFRFFDATK